jgi:L-ascorbate metabolism protein UlaG (beta-lactamase superfamily)
MPSPTSSSSALPRPADLPAYADSPQWRNGNFHNPAPRPATSGAHAAKMMWDMLFNKPANTVPAGAIPVQTLTREALLAAPDGSLYRLGHSTLLLKLRGGFWLTDPVFSERASPLQWLGPKRFHAPPIAIADLPPLEGVILSHNHFDHLDRDSIAQLSAKTQHFLAPLGVGDTLVDWGVDAAKVRQLDWWQGTQVDGLRLVATPAQHFSGRGLRDGNATLWCSWVILDGDLRVFFSGDTGYFAGFKEIGDKYGPFDVTLLETGAYDAQWPYVHMQPEETLQAHLDLGGRWLLPIHNGTFDLAMHAWHEPFDRLMALAWNRCVPLSTPAMGERLDLRTPHTGEPWWLDVPA